MFEALDLGTQGAQLLALFLETCTAVVMDAHAAVDIGFGGQRICLQLCKLHLEILQMTASSGKRRLRGDVRILDLRDAIDEKTVLDIGSRKALGRLELGERACTDCP